MDTVECLRSQGDYVKEGVLVASKINIKGKIQKAKPISIDTKTPKPISVYTNKPS